MSERWKKLKQVAKLAGNMAARVARNQLVDIDRDLGELRLRGTALALAGKVAMSRAKGVEDGRVAVHADGIAVHARKGNLVVDVTLRPQYLEIEDGQLRLGFEADRIKLDGGGWFTGALLACARLFLGEKALVRRAIGATGGKDETLVWEAPLDSVPWARALLAAVGPQDACLRLPMVVRDGDVVVSWRDQVVRPRGPSRV